MKMRTLGRNGPRISAIGLGCMRMSNFAGPKASTDEESVATIRAALDAGVNFLNTGDFYGMGHNELLVGQALQGRRDQALISVKFGALRSPSGQFLRIDVRQNAVKNFAGCGQTGVPGLRCRRCSRRARTIRASPPYPCCTAGPVRLASVRMQLADPGPPSGSPPPPASFVRHRRDRSRAGLRPPHR